MGASITCPVCLRTSHNPNDVREGYCGYCHDWTGTPPWLTPASPPEEPLEPRDDYVSEHLRDLSDEERDRLVESARRAAEAAPPMSRALAERTAARCGLVLDPVQPKVNFRPERSTPGEDTEDSAG